MDENLSQQILNAPQCASPIKNKQQAKAFMRYLWQDLKLNFTADDDFSTFGLFTADAADLLNQRMNECFELFHEQTYDLLIAVMEA
ncbi:MAG: hypothetical protein E7070_12910 [Bacteroidales bacterium]|jgi:hypothetical protein|nr:hypothetical protein [Bacteroidales bacterium]